MRVLFYNWCQFDDAHMAGGGVSLYLRNIIRELAKRDDVEVYFLSAGRKYGFFRRKPQIRSTKNAFAQFGVKSFELVNSPIKAPAHDAFHSIDTWLRDRKSTDLLKSFLKENGPFDAMHIHNLEGVSANVLSLEKDENLKSLFYTFHNYMPLCPQIELLYQGKKLCDSYLDGNRCVSCMGHNNRMNDLISYQRVAGWLAGRGLSGHPFGNFLFGVFAGLKQVGVSFRHLLTDTIHGTRTRFANWKPRTKEIVYADAPVDLNTGTKAPVGFKVRADLEKGVYYRHWRDSNGMALKQNVDGVFAVSDQARDTAKRFLPEGTEVISLPLPMDFTVTPQKRAQLRKERTDNKDVTISFVGYQIPSKGLPFFLDSLGAIDDQFYREHVHLQIIARLNDSRFLTHLDPLFKSVTVIPGYSRKQIVPLSRGIDLNVVPSIWWETFNQVTIELGLLGVPSLVSSRVGAKQTLSDHDNFVFEAENQTDFLLKLDRLVKNKRLRDSFFDQELNIPSMAQHVEELLEHYRRAILGGRDKA